MSIADNSPPPQPDTADRVDPSPPAGALQAAVRAPGGGAVGPARDPRVFLEHVPAHRRSPLANWFHNAVRGGASTPHAVWSQVAQTLQQRLQWASAPETRQFLQSVLDVLQAHKGEALTYAQYVISYERLPYAERQKIKGRRALNYVMQDKTTTEKQAALIRSKRYTGPIPNDRAEASALIDALLRQERGGQ